MTKAEFLDMLASDQRIGNKKEAAAAVDAVLDAITGALEGRRRGQLHRVRQVPRRRAGPRQGVNPRTGERISFPGGRVPRFSAGSGLKRQVKGGLRTADDHHSPTGSRRSSRSAAARSASGSIPTPRPGRGRGGSGADAPPSGRRPRSRAHCRELIAAAGPACVAVKPQLACFERLGAPGWAALEEVDRGRPRGRAAGRRRRQARRRAGHAAAYAQALVGAIRDAWGEVAGLGADAFTANPLLGERRPRAAGRGRGRARARGCSRWSGPRIPAPPTSRTPTPAGARCTSGSPGWSPSAPAGSPARRGFSGMGAVVGATAPRAHGAAARADARLDLPAFPASAPRGAGRRTSAPRSRPGRPASILVAAARSIAGADDPGCRRRGAPRRALWGLAGT